MKFISKEKIGDQSIITVEHGFWPFKRQIKYQSMDGFLSIKRWVKLPSQIEVDITMRSRLTTWNNLNTWTN